MKVAYETKAGQTAEGRRVKELEEEITKIKNYYNKRIREIEDKNRGVKNKRPPSAKDDSHELK